MKIEVIILLLLWIFNWSCKTSSAIKSTHNKTAYSDRISLANVDFYDGMIFISAGVEGHSFNYKFGDTTYQVFVYIHYWEPYQTYLMESGSYKVDEWTLILKPKLKLKCRIENIIENMDCNSTGDYANGYYVDSDTLSISEIKDLGFLPRTTEITFEDKKMLFKDPAMSSYVRFQQILR